MIKKFKKLNRNSNYKFISAMCNNKLVGFCSVVVNQDIVENQKPILLLWHLRVHPEYRNQHIGKKIVTFVEDIGKNINAEFIFLICDQTNQGARKFYTKLGYREDYGFNKYL